MVIYKAISGGGLSSQKMVNFLAIPSGNSIFPLELKSFCYGTHFVVVVCAESIYFALFTGFS